MAIKFKFLEVPKGTLVTKYVADDFYEDTKRGFLKFGRLSTYKAIEGETETRMLDSTEGGRTLLVKEPIIGQKIDLPNIKMDNCVIAGFGEAAIAIEQQFEAIVLCLMVGGYDKQHHDAFLRKGNSSITNYVTFDLYKLYEATGNLFSSILDVDAIMFGERVTYVDNSKKQAVSLDALHKSINTPDEEDFLKTIFQKPKEYSHEIEFRVAVHLAAKSKFEGRDFFVKNYLLTTASKQFNDAVVDYGKT